MRRDEKSEDDHQANAERKEFCLGTSRRDMKHGSQVDIAWQFITHLIATLFRTTCAVILHNLPGNV